MVISISTALLIISVVVGIIFIPSLITSLHGMRGSFVVIQQVCIVSNLLLVLLNEVLSTSDLDTEAIQFSYTKFSQELGLDDLPNRGSDNQRSTLVSFTSLFCLFLPPSILSIPFTSSAATTSASTYPLASFPSPKPLLSTTILPLPILIYPFYPLHLFCRCR